MYMVHLLNDVEGGCRSMHILSMVHLLNDVEGGCRSIYILSMVHLLNDVEGGCGSIYILSMGPPSKWWLQRKGADAILKDFPFPI